MSTRTGPRLEIHTQPGIERKKDIKIGSQKFELVALAQLTEYFQTFLKLNFFFTVLSASSLYVIKFKYCKYTIQ